MACVPASAARSSRSQNERVYLRFRFLSNFDAPSPLPRFGYLRATMSSPGPPLTFRAVSLVSHSSDASQCLKLLRFSWQQTYAEIIPSQILDSLSARRRYFSLSSLTARCGDPDNITFVATSPHQHQPEAAARGRSSSPLLERVWYLSASLALFCTRSRPDKYEEGFITLSALYAKEGQQKKGIGTRLMGKVLRDEGGRARG